MTPTWLATLDALKGHLDVQAARIEEGRYDEVVAFVPPADLPTLPNVLVDRASELLKRALTLTERANELREEAQRRLTRPRSLTPAQRPVSAFVDQQA